MDTLEQLTIAISLASDPALVSLRGELDLATAPLLHKHIDDLLDTNGQHRSLVLIDVGELNFCDSSGLRALLEIRNRCQRVGTNLRLTNVPANIRRILELTGTTSVLNIDTSSRGGRHEHIEPNE
jgi:anti-sigma B factor antagonist